MITRRRFIAIAAATCATASLADAPPARWSGRALGAEASVDLRGLDPEVLDEIPAMLRDLERLFSLFDPGSQVSRLNRDGTLAMPARFATLMGHCDAIHRGTQGLFDPTVQGLWAAYANGGDVQSARANIGWDRVTISHDRIKLGHAQHLTLNGIAQGFATDMVTAYLRGAGATRVLVNIGEFNAVGGPWRVGLSDPTLGVYGWSTLRDSAIGTSSPGQMRLGRDHWHILDPQDRTVPRWSSVSVEAADATTADGASTAFALASRDQIAAMWDDLPGIRQVTLVDLDGDVTRLG